MQLKKRPPHSNEQLVTLVGDDAPEIWFERVDLQAKGWYQEIHWWDSELILLCVQANKSERLKKSPTYKDLDFLEHHPEGIYLEADTYSALVKTIQRDCRVSHCYL